MIKNICKKTLSMLLVMALVLSMVPQLALTAFADGGLAGYTVDGVSYSDFQSAMNAATKSGSKGLVVVTTGGALPAGELTVPKGVTLLIPCKDNDPGYVVHDKGETLFNHDGADSSGTGLGANAYKHAELTVNAGTTLRVEGIVLINSVSGRKGGDCDITGGYGQINLNGTIEVLSGGRVDAFGYIKGSGQVNVRNGGSLGDLYVVRNWRGGSQAMKMYEAGVYPMNEYDCHNVEAAIRVDFGGSYVGLVKMYGNGQYNYTRFPQVDVKNGLIRPSLGGYVIRTYEGGIEKYQMFGGAEFADSTLTAMGVTLSTSKFLYPIDGDIHFELNGGGYKFAEDYKLLPGVKMSVASDAELTIDPEVSVVFYKEFNDVENGGTEYPQRESAVLEIEEGGRFINSGIFAGKINTESEEIFIGENPVWELDTREANGAAGTHSTNYVVLEHTVEITNPNYEHTFNKSGTVVWEGLADYTKVQKAIADIPQELDTYYEAQSVSDLHALLDQLDFHLPASKQSQADALVSSIKSAVKNLVAKTVTVFFEANGGIITPDRMTINCVGTYGTLPNPTRENYRFAGWEDASGERIRAKTEIKTLENITLYATWNLNDADYDALEDAADAVPSDLSMYTDASVAAVKAAVKAINWQLSADKQAQVDAMEQAIWDALAALELKKVSVTLNPNGGTLANQTIQVTYTQAAGALPVPQYEGFIFAGWTDASGKAFTAATVIASLNPISLTAQWKPAPVNAADYTAVFAALEAVPADLSIYSLTSVAAVTAAIDAVDFGLDANSQAAVNAMADAINAAVAGLSYKNSTLLFNANGGKVKPATKEVTYSQAAGELPVPTRDEYRFVGWFNAAGEEFTAQSIVNSLGTIALKAVWERLPAADYSAVHAALDAIPSDMSIYSNAADVSSAVEAIDWTLTVSDQAKVNAMAVAVREALAALQLKQITVTLDPNGGTVSPTTLTVVYGESLKLPTPTKGDDLFVGWYNNSGKLYTATTKVTNLVDFTLTAAWEVSEVPGADYTAVDAAIAKVPADLSMYSDASAAALKEAVEAVSRGCTADEQVRVDAMAAAIEAALSALTYRTVTVTLAPMGGTVEYTTKEVTYLSDLGELPVPVREGFVFLGWADETGNTVNKYTVVSSVKGMYLSAMWRGEDQKSADYTAVDAALAKVPADLSVYTDETAAAVKAAVRAVVRGMTDDRQAEVDAMAKAIEDAVAALVVKPIPADYSAVDAAIAKVPADLSMYTEETASAVTAAVSAVVRDLTADRQAEIDAMAKAIEDAIAALVVKPIPADYTAVDAAIAKVPADLSVYTADSAAAVTAAVDAVIRDLSDDRQAEVDAMAKAIEDAIAALVVKPAAADYTAVDAAIAKVPADLSVYTEETAAAVTAAVNAVVRDLTADRQAEVDAMAKAIEDAIAALTVKPVAKPDYEVKVNKAEDGSIINVEVIVYKADKVDAIAITEALTAAATVAEAPVIHVTLAGATVKLSIPLTAVSYGNVVCTLDAEGKETVLKNTLITAEGVEITLAEDCRIVVLNKNLSFTDVAGYWSNAELENGLDFLTSRGIIAGKTATTFVPTENIQRRTVALVLWRMAGSPEVPLDTQLTDKDSLGKTYLMAVCWAEDTGIITGYADGTFRGENELERRHFALMLYRFVTYMNIELDGETVKSLDQFPDSHKIGSASWDACQWAVDNGIINGRGNGAFDPNGTTTRGQMAVILFRFLQQYYAAEPTV